jgi:signal peptidase II
MSDFALFHQEKKGLGVRGWSLLLAASVLFLDQITKWVIIKALALYEAFSLFPGLALTLRYNEGAAFSFLAGASGWQRWLFVSLAIVISSFLYFWLGRLTPRDKREAIGLSFI